MIQHIIQWVFITLTISFSFSTGAPIPAVTIVSRAEWGARQTKGSTAMSTPVPYVFIHHTAGSLPATTSAANIAVVKSIQNYHMDNRKWDDIGYSFLIGTDGRAYEGRGWQRVGAHTKGYNDKGIGIAFLGTFTSSLPSSAQIQAAKNLIKYGLDNGHINACYGLYGHRDAASTACPGQVLYDAIKTWDRFHKIGLSNVVDHTLTCQDPAPSATVTIVSRAEWGARQTKSSTAMSTPVPYVFIHHTAGSLPATTHTANIAVVKSIQNYHMDCNKWDDIGYSFLIGTDGRAYEGRGWQRVGAHTKGYNDKGIGIAFLGTFTSSLPSSAQIQAAKNLIQYGLDNGHINACYGLYGHRDVTSTACPGQMLYDAIKTWDHFHEIQLSNVVDHTSACQDSTPPPTVTIISRAEWGARQTKSSTAMSTPVSYVFIHHTAGSLPATTHTANIAVVKSIQNYHMDSNKWDDIGYSFLIGTDGRAYEGRGWARAGAHTKGYNDKGIGIALLGDFTSSMPSSTQIQAAKSLIQYGLNNNYIASDYGLYGHRDAGNTACPGNTFYPDVKTWSHYGAKALP